MPLRGVGDTSYRIRELRLRFEYPQNIQQLPLEVRCIVLHCPGLQQQKTSASLTCRPQTQACKKQSMQPLQTSAWTTPQTRLPACGKVKISCGLLAAWRTILTLQSCRRAARGAALVQALSRHAAAHAGVLGPRDI